MEDDSADVDTNSARTVTDTRSCQRTLRTLMEIPAVGYRHTDGSCMNVGTGRLTVVERTLGNYIVWRSGSDSPDSESCRSSLEIDVSDIASLRLTSDKKECEVVQQDGSKTGALVFTSDSLTLTFLHTLHTVLPLQQSFRDSRLYLVGSGAGSRGSNKSQAPAGSATGLEHSLASMWRMVRHLPHDPRTVALTGFSKLAESFLNLGLEQDRPEEDLAELLRSETGRELARAACSSPPRLDSSHQEGFEVVTRIRLGDEPAVPRLPPLSASELQREFYTECNQLKHEPALLERVFRGGIEPELRPLLWRHLLRCEPLPGASEPGLYGSAELRRVRYESMCQQWQSMSDDQISRFSGMRERRAIVDKDVARTDRTLPFFSGVKNANVERLRRILMTYCMYNFDLGYVQGMSDLLSPILFVVDCEVDAFWCFVNFMDRLADNFELSQHGMRRHFANLHSLLQVYDPTYCSYLEHDELPHLGFTFRWLLIWFKREFDWDDVQRLWEVLWTGLPCSNFPLLVALAILLQHRSVIMESQLGFTAVIKYVNDLALCIDLDTTLEMAERIWRQFLSGCRLPGNVIRILSLPLNSEDSDSQEEVHRQECPVDVDRSAVEATNDTCDAAITLNYL